MRVDFSAIGIDSRIVGERTVELTCREGVIISPQPVVITVTRSTPCVERVEAYLPDIGISTPLPMKGVCLAPDGFREGDTLTLEFEAGIALRFHGEWPTMDDLR